jgi:hypothetical protein
LDFGEEARGQKDGLYPLHLQKGHEILDFGCALHPRLAAHQLVNEGRRPFSAQQVQRADRSRLGRLGCDARADQRIRLVPGSLVVPLERRAESVAFQHHRQGEEGVRGCLESAVEIGDAADRRYRNPSKRRLQHRLESTLLDGKMQENQEPWRFGPRFYSGEDAEGGNDCTHAVKWFHGPSHQRGAIRLRDHKRRVLGFGRIAESTIIPVIRLGSPSLATSALYRTTAATSGT